MGFGGGVVELVHAKKKPVPAPPHYVVMRFDGCIGPAWLSEERFRFLFPIAPAQTTWS